MRTASSNGGALKGALHAHTTCSDGQLTPEEVLRAHHALGFDFLALTDHDFLLKPDAYHDVPDDFEGMLVFKGVEKTVFARGYLHVNRIPGGGEVLHVFNHPGEYDLDLGEVLERLEEVRRILPIDAVEVTVKGYHTPEFDTDAIPYPKIATDDSHTAAAIGRSWIEVDCPREHGAILRAVKAGLARICYTHTAKEPRWALEGGS